MWELHKDARRRISYLTPLHTPTPNPNPNPCPSLPTLTPQDFEWGEAKLEEEEELEEVEVRPEVPIQTPTPTPSVFTPQYQRQPWLHLPIFRVRMARTWTKKRPRLATTFRGWSGQFCDRHPYPYPYPVPNPRIFASPQR